MRPTGAKAFAITRVCSLRPIATIIAVVVDDIAAVAKEHTMASVYQAAVAHIR